MKKLLLSMSLAVCFGAISQTTIYSENFTSGSTWTLNTILGAENAYPNNWYISCQEDGQTAGACGTACSISDNSLHVSANAAFGDLGAAYFEAGGFSTTHRRAESGNISTIGETTLNLSFDMIGAGNAQDYTELFYSINGGASWVSLATPLTSLCCGGVACSGGQQGLWQNNSYSLPATCENISNLRIAFVWKNFDDGIATDPSFAVDDILITAASSSAMIATTNDVAPASWCAGTTVLGTVNFVSTGTFNAGNIYSAELSDASGVFGSPTVVGTLSSSASGSLSIATSISGAIPAGTGYRIRVVASDPVTTGTNNGSNLVINPLPTVTLGTFTDVCINHAASTLAGGSPAGGTYTGTGVSAGMFDPAVAGVGSHTITYTYADGNGCINMDSEPIVVDACASISELEGVVAVTVYPNPADAAFSISTDGIISQVELLDMSGRIVKSFDASSEVYDVRDINSGVYLLQINNNSAIQTIRLVIK